MPAEAINILVIMSDQHAAKVIGGYGNDLVRTPNLDRLAAALFNLAADLEHAAIRDE